MEALLSLFEGKNIALELFGYFGTALVLLSFLMQDLKWLRIFNMSGGLISLIYAILTDSMPVVALNASLIIINAFQLARIIINKRKAATVNSAEENAYDNIKEEKEN